MKKCKTLQNAGVFKNFIEFGNIYVGITLP